MKPTRRDVLKAGIAVTGLGSPAIEHHVGGGRFIASPDSADQLLRLAKESLPVARKAQSASATSLVFVATKPDLTDDKGRKHILDGDETGGGHRAGTGKSGKSEFPADWSDEKILGEISDVATDPRSKTSQGGKVSEGARGGVDIKVVVGGGRIKTGYPTNRPRNP